MFNRNEKGQNKERVFKDITHQKPIYQKYSKLTWSRTHFFFMNFLPDRQNMFKGSSFKGNSILNLANENS